MRSLVYLYLGHGRWSFLEWYKIRSFAKSLHLLGIDLGVDFKGDIGNSWFLWNIHPKISFGYDTTGGGYFYTILFYGSKYSPI